MGYSFDFADILCTEENKLLDNFEVPQLPKFNGTGDPRIYFSQYLTVMSISKAPFVSYYKAICVISRRHSRELVL